jgi:two-component system, OmpR family, phosphate regulon sensor histidine kinase PhoR
VRGQRGIIRVATAVAVASLMTAALGALQDARGPGGWSPAALCFIAYCAGAVGVIFLGVGYGRLAGAVTSMAARFREEKSETRNSKLETGTNDQTPKSKPASARPAAAFQSLGFRASLAELTQVVEDRLAESDRTIRRLREERKDLEIQSRLSERERRHTEAILYSLHDAVLVVDGSDRLLMANDPAARLFGFDAESARHKPLAETIGETHAQFVELLRQCRCTRTEATKQELQFSWGDRPHTYETIVSCVQTEGKVSGVVAVLHDVTREKEVAQMKNDFVSHVSHELKTPLASITAYSEMLADGEADDEETRKEFYTIIQSQARRLNRLIEDILNVSRIESGLIKVNKQPASLTILIEEQLQMIRSYADEKNITVAGGKPIVYDQVYIDKDMICQVVINLLSNAVKYTPAGGHVTIGTEVDEAARLVRVTVTDTGVGIPEDEVDRVFDKFYRVAANNKQAKGTGLGLNLVKQIVEKVHGGRVFVASQVGVGSTFGFELPLATAREAVGSMA